MSDDHRWATPFKGLKKALRNRRAVHAKSTEQARATDNPSGARVSSAQADKDRGERTVTDNELFAQAMSDVRQINAFRALPAMPLSSPPPSPPRLRGPGRDKANEDEGAIWELRELVARRRSINLSDTDEYMEWAPPSMSLRHRRELTRTLHEGGYAVGDYIDLHGLTEDQAWEALLEFLRNARRLRVSCVKVIHGRGLRSPGEPVLKGAVGRWLKGPLSKYVVAYATARPCDGGLGATYVLLRLS